MIEFFIKALAGVALLSGLFFSQKTESVPSPDRTDSGNKTYAVRTELKEQFFADPEKWIGVYGRYTELKAEGEVPEALSRVLAEVNARAKNCVEAGAERFLAENRYQPAAGADEKLPIRYRNLSYIVNVTRADDILFSILETEMESGIGDAEGTWLRAPESCRFRSAVYDTASGKELTLSDFLKDDSPERVRERLEQALSNKYGSERPAGDGETALPAWTADHLGLRFYLDGTKDSRKAFHVSLPYTELDGAFAKTAAGTPESFIAQLEKNKDYALPHDSRVIRVEKAVDDAGQEAYRIVIRDKNKEKAWWLEYAGDASDFYVFRAQGRYYFYRLEDAQDRAFVYDFADPDGGYDRFANQNAQCFDSFLHELNLAVPYDPDCVHMRERSRQFMEAASSLNTIYAPNGHYAFRPEKGRGRTWLHFALTDETLALDSRNVGCRLLQEISAAALTEEGDAAGETVVPAGEVLRFLCTDQEAELYYYMSTRYNEYRPGARVFHIDCALQDGRKVRLESRYEDSIFLDGMYLGRIAEAVTIGGARYEAGASGIEEHFVEIGGKQYRLIWDPSLQSEAGEEIDFAGDLWWQVENYVGTFVSEKGDAKLVISADGEAVFTYGDRVFRGKLPEKRRYGRYAEIYMEAEYERRTFRFLIQETPVHDPSFTRFRFYSEGEPATNEPSRVPPIEVELVRE